MTASLTKEKETYEALYVNSELGSLHDDDSVRSNSLRRAMSESSGTSQGVVEQSRTRATELAQVHQSITRKTQARPILEATNSGPWYVVRKKYRPRDGDTARSFLLPKVL